jgi:hypothetical protein
MTNTEDRMGYFIHKMRKQHFKPALRPQMHILTRRLLELDTTEDANNYRCYIYNQRRRELEGPSSAPRWWVATYRFNRYLLPMGAPEPAVKYFYR